MVDGKDGPKGLLDTVAGQLTAVLSMVGVLIYLAGVSELALKLWVEGFGSGPVVGQLPRNPVVVQSLGAAVPALLIGVPISLWLFRRPHGRHMLLRIGLSAGLAVAIAGLSCRGLRHHNPGARSAWPVFALTAAVLVVVNVAGTWAVWRLKIRSSGTKGMSPYRLAYGAVVVTCVAAAFIVVNATRFPFPIATFCGPHVSLQGDLIGSSSDTFYVAQFDHDEVTNKITGRRLALVPRSEVQFVTVSKLQDCTQVQGAVPVEKPSPNQS